MFNEFANNDGGRSVGRTIRSSILQHVMHKGGFVIPEIAQATGYSLTTVAKYVADMIAEGKVLELDKVSLHVKGRRTVRYGVNSDSCYFLGVDMRAFELNIGLVDFTGNIVKIEQHTDFRLNNTREAFDEICSRVLLFIENIEHIDTSKILAANVNVPGRVNGLRGTSASTFNFEETCNTTLAEIFSERLGIRSFIENDTKAMTHAEWLSGLQKRYDNLLYINAGWGLGVGIVVNGQLCYGKDGYSGEFGHIHHYDNNILCHCGKKGCIETEVSGRAIYNHLLQRVGEGEASILSRKIKKGSEISTQNIIEAIKQEDPLCIELVSQTGMELGRHIAGLINLFNPEIIVIGGNLSQVEACYFLQPIETAIRKYSLKLMSQDVPITTSTLGVVGGVIGACLIARSKVFGNI